MNKALQNICCVCSGNGDNDIFSRIPVNAHANPTEFLYWKKTIAEFIGEITGICVSYSMSQKQNTEKRKTEHK